MSEEGLYEIKDESKINEIIPLVSEPYTYENMVNNPIIKPIAECDRSLRDLDEVDYKTLIDMKRLKTEINAEFSDVPSYQDTSFVSKLIRLTQLMEYHNKIQDLEIYNLKDCIKKSFDETKSKYWIKLDEKEEPYEPETIIPEGNVSSYLDKLIEGTNENHKLVATAIKEIFLKTAKGQNEMEKLENAGLEMYSKETDKTKKSIIAKIIRMEL
jgi:hypothetical protein